MNLSGTGTCLCGETMKGSGGSISSEAATTWRSCECGVKALFYSVSEDKELSISVVRKDQEKKDREEREKLLSLFALADIQVENHWNTYGYGNNPWVLAKTSRGIVEIGWRKRVVSIDWKDTGIKCLVDGDATKDEHMCHAYSYETCITNLRKVFSTK